MTTGPTQKTQSITAATRSHRATSTALARASAVANNETRTMKNATAEKLDTEELLQLAIRASESNQHEESLSYLKRALDLSPDNGKLHYMLGAEHAQLGLYDRAVAEIARAVELEPDLYTAHFQLGLLHITAGRLAEAELAWKPLDKLGRHDSLFLFKSGLLHLARDEFGECVKHLQEGIKLNITNLALNNDMQRVLGEAETALNAAGTPPAAVEKAGKVSLSAYQNEDEK